MKISVNLKPPKYIIQYESIFVNKSISYLKVVNLNTSSFSAIIKEDAYLFNTYNEAKIILDKLCIKYELLRKGFSIIDY